MAIEQGRNTQSFETYNDDLDEEFARFVNQMSPDSAQALPALAETSEPSLLEVHREDGFVRVKAGWNLTFTYPKDSPLDVRVIGEGVEPRIVSLAHDLFVSVVALEFLRQNNGNELRVCHWESVRSQVGFRLADAGRLDIVDAGRQVSWLPGIGRR